MSLGVDLFYCLDNKKKPAPQYQCFKLIVGDKSGGDKSKRYVQSPNTKTLSCYKPFQKKCMKYNIIWRKQHSETLFFSLNQICHCSEMNIDEPQSPPHLSRHFKT